MARQGVDLEKLVEAQIAAEAALNAAKGPPEGILDGAAGHQRCCPRLPANLSRGSGSVKAPSAAGSSVTS